VGAACPTPRLNLSSELHPSGNNIQDTFPTGSTQDTTTLQLAQDEFNTCECETIFSIISLEN